LLRQQEIISNVSLVSPIKHPSRFNRRSTSIGISQHQHDQQQ